MTIEIKILGPLSTIKGPYPRDVVRGCLSYPVKGAEYSEACRSGRWDGRKHLLNRRTGAFPTGLLPGLERLLSDLNLKYDVEDLRPVPTPTKAGFALQGITFDPPYDYQLEVAETMVEKRQGIAKIATGGGKTEIAAAVTQYLGLPTLFLVPSRELMYQTHKRFKTRLGLGDDEVGVVGDGTWAPGSLVTVAIVDTLVSRNDETECQQLIKDAEVLFLDECHGVGSDGYYTVATQCPAYYRYGLSATPLDRTDGANMMLIAATGELVCDIRLKELIERKVCASADIIYDKITEPILPEKTHYSTAYKEAVVENMQLLDKVIDWTEAAVGIGLNVLILIEQIGHGHDIDNALWMQTESMIPHQFISGKETMETRKGALQSFTERKLPVLISSTILDQGVDTDAIDVLILAGSKRSRIRTLQRIGRGLRGKKLIVIEFANMCHKYLMEHSYVRMQDYKAEECLPIHYSAPDADLLKKLWNRPR